MSDLETLRGSDAPVFTLAGKGLQKEQVAALSAIIQEKPNLHTLDVSHNPLGAAGGALLNSNLTQLNLSATAQGVYGMILAAAVGESLEKNTQLASLFLHQCDLSKSAKRGVQVLFEGVGKNTHLAELGLMANHINGDATMALSNMIADNHTLASLVLSFNEIDDKDMDFLAKALKKNQSLARFDISQNNLSEESKYQLADAIEKSRSKNMVYAKLDIAGPLQQTLDEKLVGNRNEAIKLYRKLSTNSLDTQEVAEANARMNAIIEVAHHELFQDKSEIATTLVAAQAKFPELNVPAYMQKLAVDVPNIDANAGTVKPRSSYQWLG
jgi:Ran GTPase-activating protein (RanGAP) involved in mRNA processing and transport